MIDSFTRAVPKTAGELRVYMMQLFSQRQHVRGVVVDPSDNRVEFRMDEAAHKANLADVYIPIRKGKINSAKSILEKMWTDIQLGFAPSDSDTQELFDVIDPLAA